MKFLYFDDYRLGIVKGNGVVDITDELRDIPNIDHRALINGLIARFDDYRERLAAVVAREDAQPLSGVTLRPPLPLPRNIDCMAVNYMEDGTRDAPAPINAFHKSQSAIIGPGDTMMLDDIPASVFEGEAEVAVIIGKTADHVSQAEAMDYVFGYTNFIDGSARGLSSGAGVFFQMKSRDTYAPIGPYIVTADEIPDPQNLQVRLRVNGTVMQDFNTSDMAHNIARCIEWTSSIHTLEPGDILATGTNHRGLSAFQDGDRVELEAEGLGCLSINIRDDLKRTWSRDTRLEHAEQGLDGAHTPQLTGKYAE
jgi:2-keto-4-pentenoate hydratase/2-oxohepta-3-ene-1,7-dioic acid hydratase in catechol pathway